MTTPHRLARGPAAATLFAALLAGLLAAPHLAHAGEGEGEARRSAEQARAAARVGDHERALELLERAWIADPDPIYLYERILILEQMGQSELALQILREHREALMAQPDVNDLVVIEQRLENHGAPAEPAATVAAEAVESDAGDTLLGWSLVAGGTTALVAGGALAMSGAGDLDRVRCSGTAIGTPECEEVAPFPETTEAGLRRREDDAQLQVNAGLGVALLGGALLGWGLYELLTTSEPAAKATLTLSPHPDGASAALRLCF